MNLTGHLPHWDIEYRTIDISSIKKWTLSHIQQQGYALTCLEDAHHHLTPAEALALSQYLTRQSLDPCLRTSLYHALTQSIPELNWQTIHIQTLTHFRILIPTDTFSPVPTHTDYGFGHLSCERNLWIALTNALDQAALRIATLETSLSFLKHSQQQYGIISHHQSLPPRPAYAGDLILFSPLHLHAASPPPPQVTRVSIDVRIIPSTFQQFGVSFSPMAHYLPVLSLT